MREEWEKMGRQNCDLFFCSVALYQASPLVSSPVASPGLSPQGYARQVLKDSVIGALEALNGVPRLVQEDFLEKATSRQKRNQMKWGCMLKAEQSFKPSHETGQLI